MEDLQLIQEENLPTEFQSTDEKVLGQAKAHDVKDQESYDIAVALGKAFHGVIKERKEYFKPRKDAAKRVWQNWVDAEKDSIEPIEKARAILSKKVLSYEREQEEIRRAEEERQRKLAAERARKEREEYERQQEELRKQAEIEDVSQEELALMDQPFEPTVSPDDVVVESTFQQGGQTRKTWAAEVTDFKAMIKWCLDNGETDLLLPDEKKLNSLARAHKKDSHISGVKFYKKSTKIL